jgi:hypothetical protein
MESKIVNLEVNSNLDATEKSVGSLKSQLRQAQNEVTALSEKFGATSREAVNAAKKAGELKDRIGDAKALTDAFNPDAKFKALTASLSGVAGGFAAYQGALGLVGIESKDLERQLLKVQSAMAISQGLQSVGESIDSFKQLGAVIKNTSVAQKVLSATTAAYTFVTGAATTGLKLFRAALIGTGIGAIVVGLGLLIANFDKVKNAVLNVIPGLKSVGDFFGSIVNAVTDFVGATSDATRALDKLKTDADNTLKVNKKFMTEHGDQLDEYTKRKIEAKNAYAEALKEDGANQVELAKRLNRELAKADADRQAEKDKKAKEIKDKEKVDSDKTEKDRLDKIAKQKEDSTKEAEDFFAKANENEIKNQEALKLQREGQLEALATYNDAITNEENKAADDRIKIAQAEAQQKEDIRNAQFALAEGAVNFLKEIGGKNKAIQKAAIIAENAIGIGKMIIANNAANIGALATPQAILTSGASAVPVIAMNNITTALGVATTIASTAKALQAVGGGSAGSPGSVGGVMSGGGTTAPQFNVVGNSGANQLAQTLGREQPPIKAYVTASDVSTGQSLNRNIITNASLG